MIRPIVTLTVCLLAATAVGPADSREIAGAWTATTDEHGPQRLSFSMQTGRHDHQGSQFDLSDFTGLTSEQVNSATRVTVQFELRREAGTIAYEGTFRNGRGAGEFTFTSSPDFPGKLRSVGVKFEPERGDEDRELFNLTVFDVTTDFIRSMQAIGYMTGEMEVAS